jgi:hypothetical protein
MKKEKLFSVSSIIQRIAIYGSLMTAILIGIDMVFFPLFIGINDFPCLREIIQLSNSFPIWKQVTAIILFRLTTLLVVVSAIAWIVTILFIPLMDKHGFAEDVR